MEYNIYDLMDEFADEDIELSPYNAADLRRIEELTMKKIEEQQGRRPAAKKAGRIARALLVAAVVTALCTATVVAAKLGVADSFKGYFGDLTAEQKQVMEALGTTDLQPVTSNGTTITLSATRTTITSACASRPRRERSCTRTKRARATCSRGIMRKGMILSPVRGTISPA